MPTIEQIPIDDIEVGDRHRAYSEETVSSLAKSIEEIGLQTPVTVWKNGDGPPVLIAGLQRLEAARRLGWDEIPATYATFGELECEMWEVSENLHRADLTTEERDYHIRKYAELLAKKNKTRHGVAFSDIGSGAAGPGRGHKGAARQIADDNPNLSVRTVQRALEDENKKKKKKPDLSVEQHAKQIFNKFLRLWDEATDAGEAGEIAKQNIRDFLA